MYTNDASVSILHRYKIYVGISHYLSLQVGFKIFFCLPLPTMLVGTFLYSSPAKLSTSGYSPSQGLCSIDLNEWLLLLILTSPLPSSGYCISHCISLSCLNTVPLVSLLENLLSEKHFLLSSQANHALCHYKHVYSHMLAGNIYYRYISYILHTMIPIVLLHSFYIEQKNTKVN